MTAQHSSFTLQLNTHGMICPNCLEDDGLRVTFTGTCMLTNQGSVDEGDHEWDDDSPCQCTRCNFSAPVSVFRLGDEDEAIDIVVEDPQAGERAPSFDPRSDLDLTPHFAIVCEGDLNTHHVIVRGEIGLFSWDIEKGTRHSLREAGDFDAELRKKYASILVG